MPIPKRYILDQSTDQAATISVATAHATKKIDIRNRMSTFSVELGGFEPPTSSMPWKRATNCAIAPYLVRRRGDLINNSGPFENDANPIECPSSQRSMSLIFCGNEGPNSHHAPKMSSREPMLCDARRHPLIAALLEVDIPTGTSSDQWQLSTPRSPLKTAGSRPSSDTMPRAIAEPCETTIKD